MKSDGSTADYYKLPEGATEIQHLISHRNLNAQDGEMFRAIYRKGRASHSDELRDARKVLFYAQAEVERLEKLHKPTIVELYGVTSQERAAAMATAWEEGEKRMERIGPNGNDGLAYENEWIPSNGKKPDLPNGTIVQVMFANGCTAGGCTVDSLVWERDDSDDDITRYRVLRPEPEWIPGSGQEPDLPDGTTVDIKFADGRVTTKCRVGHWIWTQDGESDDITHYRIYHPE